MNVKSAACMMKFIITSGALKKEYPELGSSLTMLPAHVNGRTPYFSRRHAEQIVDKCGKGDFDSEKHKEELEASSEFAVRCKMWEKSERRQRSLMKWHMHNERAEVIKDRLINLGYPEADTKAVWRMRSITNQKSPLTDRIWNRIRGAVTLCVNTRRVYRMFEEDDNQLLESRLVIIHFCWSLPLHLRLLGAPDDHDITQAALEEAVNSQQLQIDIHRAVVQKLTTTIEQYRPDIVVNASRIGANPFEMAEIAFLCRICHVCVPTLSGAIRHMGNDESIDTCFGVAPVHDHDGSDE
ncbi:hypothetical protein Moror_12338 [Moniliophthora roreri MCA 2997]|uniref:Uncharacterized protein n=1 Tax=Moniliophthora roreri (strain MCA 2997) TaxID=1381753 RepID=V2XTH6_MONRO|nr:hypothetical protein Moror_12338 [Moniliophthora roreri MCA 2997]